MPTARTIPSLWREGLVTGHPEPAYLHLVDGDWVAVSRTDAGAAVGELANGLLALGLSQGEAFAIMARTTLEWALFDFALACVGAIGAPIYSSSSAHDVRYVLDHSHAVGLLVEDDAARNLAEGTGVRHVLAFSDLDELRAQGRAFAAAHPEALRDRESTIADDDLFTYIYTSGTTGPPKACMIRHRNYHAMATKSDGLESRLTAPGDTMLLFLPLAHNYGRLLHLSAAHVGYTVAFLPDPLRLVDELPRVRPTLLPGVPRIYEKIHDAVRAELDAVRGPRRVIVQHALRVGRRASELRQARRPVPLLLRAQHRMADRLVYPHVKERLGGRLRHASSGGAPLPLQVAEFLHALDILVLEGYGLSELTTAATVNRPDDFRFGTVGKPLPGVEIRLARDGEILIRSDTVFAGYLADDAATRETIDAEGFVHTGDVGHVDPDGFLVVTDRKKDIIVTAGGKNVAPQNLENELRTHRIVSQAVVVGDRRPYVAALVAVDPAAADGLAADEVEAAVQDAVDAVNRERSGFEQIKRFAILPREPSLEHGELTPTLKVRRKVVLDHFAAEVETLYANPRTSITK